MQHATSCDQVGVEILILCGPDCVQEKHGPLATSAIPLFEMGKTHMNTYLEATWGEVLGYLV